MGRIVLHNPRVPALVFRPRSFHAQEEKETDQAMAMGSNHLCVSLQSPVGAAMAAFARSPLAPRDRRAAASRNLSRHGLFSLPSSTVEGLRRSGIDASIGAAAIAKTVSDWRRVFRLLSSPRRDTFRCPGKSWSIRASSRPMRSSKSCRWFAANGKALFVAAAPICTRIREYMPEDSARHVDWKATAKSGSLKVREFAREDERKLCIAFDNPEPGAISERAYEKAVDLTASLAWHFSTQEAEVSFAIPGRPRTRDLHEFLAWLAVIEPGSARAIHPAGKQDRPPYRRCSARNEPRRTRTNTTLSSPLALVAPCRRSCGTPLTSSSLPIRANRKAPPDQLALLPNWGDYLSSQPFSLS